MNCPDVQKIGLSLKVVFCLHFGRRRGKKKRERERSRNKKRRKERKE